MRLGKEQRALEHQEVRTKEGPLEERDGAEEPVRDRRGCTAGRGLPQRPGREGTPAFGARRRRPTRARRAPVDALVAQHVLAAPEALAALPASERPRARVRLAVAHQVLAPVEGLAALAAGVWLLARRQRAQGRTRAAGVRAAVAPQVLLAPEGLAALGAGVRLLARVALPMAQQVRRLQRGLAALGAGRGARGRQEGGQAGRRWGRWRWLGAARLLLVRARGLGVPRRQFLSPGGCVSCRQRRRVRASAGHSQARAGREGGPCPG